MRPVETGQERSGPPLIWEQVACPLCAARDEEELLRVRPEAAANSYRLVRCRKCGLGYLNPRPDEASIEQFYPDEYMCYEPPPRRRWWTPAQQRLRRLVMAQCFGIPPALRSWRDKLLARFAGLWLRPPPSSMTALPYAGAGRLLDFGCGSGWYAHRMAELGWDVTGMDFNREVVAQVQQRFGIPVVAGTLPHPDIQAESFDAITMGAVLEHVHRPHEVIEAAARALRPGGYLAVSVPNIASWGFRYGGADWWGLQLPHHLLHFSPVTLRRLLEAHGLEVRELRVIGRPGWMRRSLATLRERGDRRALTQLARLRIIASLLTRWTVWRQHADCIVALAYRPSAESHRLTLAA